MPRNKSEARKEARKKRIEKAMTVAWRAYLKRLRPIEADFFRAMARAKTRKAEAAARRSFVERGARADRAHRKAVQAARRR